MTFILIPLMVAYNAYNNSGFDVGLCFVIDRDGSQLYDPLDGEVQVDDWGGMSAKHIGRECESVYLMKQPFSHKAVHKAFWMINPANPRSLGNEKAGWNSLMLCGSSPESLHFLTIL